MREGTKIKLGEKTITVFELTVEDCRRWIAESAQQYAEADLVRAALLEGISLYDIARMTDLSLEDMDRLTPSQLQEIAEHCRKVNGVFFGMCSRASQLADQLGRPEKH